MLHVINRGLKTKERVAVYPLIVTNQRSQPQREGRGMSVDSDQSTVAATKEKVAVCQLIVTNQRSQPQKRSNFRQPQFASGIPRQLPEFSVRVCYFRMSHSCAQLPVGGIVGLSGRNVCQVVSVRGA
ncbi:hypothetical protein PoB_004680700 [Plakobranchus ocellatus]|uniref:Uncharacterized protein n=1 Tax=Plakobranchus ocellatus TaxID=259542 RepID=A0AAV4BLS5_9GAST|nr:hypothetical protein PoB_004680700 [Plakobranchus ocellatus]